MVNKILYIYAQALYRRVVIRMYIAVLAPNLAFFYILHLVNLNRINVKRPICI